MLITRNLQLSQEVLHSTTACILSLFIIFKVWFQLFLFHCKTQQILLEILEKKSLSSLFLLILFDEGIGSDGVSESKLLADCAPALGFKAFIFATKFVIIVFSAIAEEAFNFFLVGIKDGLDTLFLIDIPQQLFIQFLNLMFFLVNLKLFLDLLL